MNIRFILAAMLLMFGLSAASAAPDCMTLREARHAHPNVHLWWSGDHCWSDTRGGRHVAARHHKIQSSGGDEVTDLSTRQAKVRAVASGSDRFTDAAPRADAGVAPSPPETAWPRVVHITMAVAMFNERWPEPTTTISSVSPLRWSRELIEFGK